MTDQRLPRGGDRSLLSPGRRRTARTTEQVNNGRVHPPTFPPPAALARRFRLRVQACHGEPRSRPCQYTASGSDESLHRSKVLPAPLPELALPALLPADLPFAGRAALAAALAGTLPGGRPERGMARAAGRACSDEGESRGCAGSWMPPVIPATSGASAARITALFPHVRQVFLVERYSYGPAAPARRRRRPRHHQPAPGPGQPRRPAGVPARPLGHRNAPLRDVCLREDASRVSRAHQAMAAIRNTVIGILHLHQIPNIAAQLRICTAPLPAPAAAPRPHQAPGAANRNRTVTNATIPQQPGRPFRAPTPASPDDQYEPNQPPDPLNE